MTGKGKEKILVFDTETTGLDPDSEEVLQLAIIDGDNKEIFNDYFRPSARIMRRGWARAEAVNQISKEMVKDKRTLADRKAEIQAIFDTADLLIAYNAGFDIDFLKAAGIDFHDTPVFDLMPVFARIYGEWNDYFGDYKWQKLTTAAAYYDYSYDPHDALADVRATLAVFNAMIACGDVKVDKISAMVH